MAIFEQVKRIKKAKEDIKLRLRGKGVEVSDTETIDKYPSKIDEIIDTASYNLLDGSLTSITIPDAVTTLHPYRFYKFPNLIGIDFKNIKTIPEHICDYCSNLTDLIMNAETTYIGPYAFNECRNLHPISIPQSVTEIGDYAFQYAGYSKGNSYTWALDFVNKCKIGSYAFRYTYLNEVKGNFSSIGSYAFSSISTLKKLIIEDVESISSSAFNELYYVEEFEINPEVNVKSLGSSAFRYLGSRRTNIDTPIAFDFSNSTFTAVESSTFSGSSSYYMQNLEVTLPNTVTEIKSESFRYNKNLKLFLNNIPNLSSTNAFSNNTDLVILVAPEDLGTIKTKTNWTTYANNIIGYGKGAFVGVGNSLPLYIKVGGFGITWYSDSALTEQLTDFVITEENVNNTFYCSTSSEREVGWVNKISLLDCEVVLTDTNGNTYNEGDYIPVGTEVTVTVNPTDSSKQQIYMLLLNNLEIENGSSFVVSSDIDVVALCWNGTDYPFFTTLADNTLAMIAQCCRLGLNSTMWNIGDTFNITLTNGDVVTCRYCDDVSGRYMYSDGSGNTNAVFEIVELIRKDSSTTTFRFNPSSNTDSDGCYNNWEISELRASMNSGDIWNLFPDEFKAILKPVNIITAKNGNNGTLVTTSDCLFLPAEREIFSSRTFSRTEEWNALGSQYAYYYNNNTNSKRIKYKYGTTTANYWWERSPYSGNSGSVCGVISSGNAGNSGAGSNYGVSPCFAL